ncbi:PREDICTED: uncharacterized protein LOC108977439, partial [Bactrocera latifrons]|uniref:uncharacterized protein LOC108977439 n=1 Tax=Bactrocera latifrons TaxID=174628 RepID=UPI0008DCA10B
MLKFVGYAEGVKGYRLYNSENKSITISRDVIFFEESICNEHNVTNVNRSCTNESEFKRQTTIYTNYYFDDVVAVNDIATVNDAEDVVAANAVAENEHDIAVVNSKNVNSLPDENISDDNSFEDDCIVVNADGRVKRGRPKIITTGRVGKKRFAVEHSDWASDATDRKSVTGFIVFFGGGPVQWEAKKQNVVALSSMEAEYIAMCQGTKELMFLR